MEWPKKKDQLKHVGDKTTFADTCQYDSDKVPGPGTYNMRTHLSCLPVDKKWQAHSPIQPQPPITAENGNYSPCPQSYNTFLGYELHRNSSHQTLSKKSPDSKRDRSKENLMPGPGTYSTISCWPGKSPPKKNEINYFSVLTKGPSFGVYH